MKRLPLRLVIIVETNSLYNPMISLYIHIPFCSRHCPYCSFYKQVPGPDGTFSAMQPTLFIQALIKEMSFYFESFGKLPLHTLYFGGGTPNRLSSSDYAQIFEALHRYFILPTDMEISMEMNPELVTSAFLNDLKQLGLNRISLGVQSFIASELEFLGRHHSASHSISAVHAIKESGITNFNLDLIFSLPHSNLETLDHNLNDLLSLSPPHVSLYSLSIEKGTSFYKNGVSPLPQEDELEHYFHIKHRLEEAGLCHYEVSAFSKPGHRCAHNLSYWTLAPYIGLGPSASSYWDGYYYKHVSDLSAYCTDPISKRFSDTSFQPVPLADQLKDVLVSSFRLLDGVPISTINSRFNIDFEARYSKVLTSFYEQGLLKRIDSEAFPAPVSNYSKKGPIITVTHKGLALLDTVLEAFM